MALAATWIVALSIASLAGWLLSLAGWLSCPGYLGTFLVSVLLLGGLSARWRPRPRRSIARRFRRPLPAVYLLLLVLAGLGGALYAPSNYDALTYRIPRALHWLAAGRWHWITTANPRMNYSGTAQEWGMAALYACAPSDRLFFLLNLSAYALMPTLIFVTLRALGVRRRAAWVWMWLLPSAHVFALQAGSVGNDALAIVCLLAALAFAARAASRRSVTALWIATLAAALLSGIKASNLPLLLPCAIAILPSWRLALSRRLATATVLAVCLAMSFIPTAILNRHYTGDWTGDPTNADHLKAADPTSGIIGNTLQAAYINLTPPFVPHAADLNRAATRLIPPPLAQRLAVGFPRFRLEVNELPQEEVAGLGIAISLLVLSCLASGPPPTRTVLPARWIIAGGWIALAVFAASLGSEATGRLLAPYYFLPIAGVLRLGSSDRHARQYLWRALAVAAALTAVPALILTPSRPLIPAAQIASAVAHHYPNNAIAARAAAVYTNYRQRPYAFAPVLAALPATAVRLDVIAGKDDPEATMWRPFGHRVVHDITTPAQLLASDGDALICAVDGLDSALATQIAQLRTVGRIRWVQRVPVLTSVKRGAEPWDVYTRN
jgi:hypothetical protein